MSQIWSRSGLQVTAKTWASHRRPGCFLAIVLAFILPLGEESTAAGADLPAAGPAAQRLALIARDPEVAEIAESLLPELSKRDDIQMLERAEIERIYREQALSASNQDALKLGQLLGADGLLILELAREGPNVRLSARLVAVRPGVVIGAVRSAWPIPKPDPWAGWLIAHFAPLIPKLRVPAGEALPLSVVGLRSALRSASPEDSERQLTLLAIERLSREPALFVLERRQMQALSREKEMKEVGDDAFWNGSYLLEGVIDREGVAADRVTLSIRLIPPRGGTPIPFEVAGARTNFSEVINQLADRTRAALKLAGRAESWTGEAEAARYLEEARWALRWDMVDESATAAESAWLLGRKDLDCARVRVGARVAQVRHGLGVFQEGMSFGNSGTKPDPRRLLERSGAEPSGHVLFRPKPNALEYVVVLRAPEPGKIAEASQALGLYLEFTRTMPAHEPVASSPWYALGVTLLDGVSQVLRHVHAFPEAVARDEAGLAELRALARQTATRLKQVPSVRASFRPGDTPERPVSPPRTLADSTNVFRTEVEYGCFWPEKPEEAVENYRGLLGQAGLGHLGPRLWLRPVQSPPLVGWSPSDEQRASELWSRFRAELSTSTNLALQLEGRALGLAEASRDDEFQRAIAPFLETLEALRAQPGAGLPAWSDLEPRLATLIEKTTTGNLTPAKEELKRRFSELRRKPSTPRIPPSLNAAHGGPPPGGPATQAATGSALAAVGKVSRALAVTRAFRMPIEQLNLPRARDFSASRPRLRDGRLLWDFQVVYVTTENSAQRTAESDLDLDGSALWSPETLRWELIPQPKPLNISQLARSGPVNMRDVRLVNTELFEGALLALFRQELRRYDLAALRWESILFPLPKPARLFVIGQRLFAANEEGIFEIVKGGKDLRILASCRRQPAVSTLDTLDKLGPVTLFPGPGDSICALVRNAIHRWDGQDWKPEPLLGPTLVAEAQADATVLRSSTGIRLLPHQGQSAELVWATAGGNSRPGSLAEDPVAAVGNTLFFLHAHSGWSEVALRAALEQTGRHADLLVLARGQARLQTVPLRLEPVEGVTTVSLPRVKGRSAPERPWVLATPDWLYFGNGTALGFWALPRREVDAFLANDAMSPEAQ